MAGFFGLFGKKTKYVDEQTNDEASGKDDYYLNEDDARSLGTKESVRKANPVKATQKTESQPTSKAKNASRPLDTNMDTFRKMAREIKKK